MIAMIRKATLFIQRNDKCAGANFFARIKEARKHEINDCDYCQRPKPACQTAALVMPDGGSDDTSERPSEA